MRKQRIDIHKSFDPLPPGYLGRRLVQHMRERMKTAEEPEGNTPMRTVRISNADWAYLTEAAEIDGRTVSDLIRGSAMREAASILARHAQPKPIKNRFPKERSR